MTKPSSLQNGVQAISSRIIVGKTRARDEDGFCGTIEYLGPVASAKDEQEVYAGISWDDLSRGKHDGSVICKKTKQLVRHFSSKAGSFMRLSKLDLGVPLDISLLQSRYVERTAPLVAPNNLLPHTARTSSGKEKSIEFHGEVKLRDYQQPQLLSRIALRNMGISTISTQLTGFDNLKELDLGGNLISDWGIVANIVGAFPMLNYLNIASNRVGDLGKTMPEFQSTLINTLNLHSCGIKSSRTIEMLDKVFPELNELCLAYNDLSDLSMLEEQLGFHSLEKLDMTSCKITSWSSQVKKFSKISSLKCLLLNDNDISSVNLEEGETFLSLEHVNMAGTSITGWEGIQDLLSLPKLYSLSLRSTSLTSSMGAAEARLNIIARYPNITVVNSSPVSEKERCEAERRYVSQVTQELLLMNDCETKKKQILKEKHPQFAHLAENFYSDMERNGTSVSGLSAVTSYTVNIMIRSMASGSCHMDPIQRRLPSSLTVGRLKSLCSRVFGLDVDLQVLHYRCVDDAFPTELNEDTYTLAYYGITDSGEVLMNELDLEALKESEEKKHDLYEEKISKQENETSIMQEIQRDLRRKGLL